MCTSNMHAVFCCYENEDQFCHLHIHVVVLCHSVCSINMHNKTCKFKLLFLVSCVHESLMSQSLVKA